MDSEFVPYEQALDLKELGFDEPCIAWYDNESGKFMVLGQENTDRWHTTFFTPEITQAPTFSQAFRWFREKYFLFGQITIAEYELENNGFEYEIKSKDKSIDTWRGGYKTYEEAELECLKKLIEIVKKEKK